MLDSRAEFQEIVVPANLNKVVEFFRDRSNSAKHGKISLRIWPDPVVHIDDQKQLVYAIGIEPFRNELYDFEPFEKKGADIPKEIMDNILDYDPKIGLISFTLATGHDFEGMPPKDNRVQRASTASTAPPPPPTVGGSSTPAKFRTARAALSRLRHDPKHADIKYEVGYEDRFVKGLVWLPLEMWGGKEVEDEDFIPEHRIRQLRRLGDEVVVWDRARKIDLTGDAYIRRFSR